MTEEEVREVILGGNLDDVYHSNARIERYAVKTVIDRARQRQRAF